MASIDKIKGRFLFGTDEASSIPNLNGAGSLTYAAGSGGVTYHSNYVDLKTGSRFITPFNSTPRNRTIIIAGHIPVWEQVFDGDSVLRWPTTVLSAAAMRLSPGYLVAWPAVGFFGMIGASVTFRAETGADVVLGTYDQPIVPVAYRDATFTIMPAIFIIGHGVTVADNYLAATVGREMAWKGISTAYSGAAPAAQPTTFGHTAGGAVAGTQAGAHVGVLGFAEYSYLTKPEVLEAATEMVELLEPRGWQNIFHNPVTSE